MSVCPCKRDLQLRVFVFAFLRACERARVGAYGCACIGADMLSATVRARSG